MAWMSETVTLVEQLWKEADKAWKDFNETPIQMDNRVEQLKGRIRGLCWALALFMQPHFTSEDAVLREIMKRGKLGSEYETPGIGARRYEAPPGTEPKYAKTERKAANPGGLTDDQMKQIWDRPDLIPADLMAAGYGVTGPVIEAVRKLRPVA